MNTGFLHGFADVPGRKYYDYHGLELGCNIEPGILTYTDFENKYGPAKIYGQELKITTLYQCGDGHGPPNLFAPLGYNTCDPNFVIADDIHYLYTKTVWWAGAGQALYNKESFLEKIKYKVVAIQSITVYMKGEVFITAPCNNPYCGPGKGGLYVGCTYTENSWPSICLDPGSVFVFSHEWEKFKQLHSAAHNWDMESLEEKAKIGFRVDQCTETDPNDYGKNKTRCYYVYCLVKYKNTMIYSLGFGDLDRDIGTDYADLSGRVIYGKNGRFILGFQVWKKSKPEVKQETLWEGDINQELVNYKMPMNGLTPGTEYKYRALLRNTGVKGDTVVGIIKGFITKNV